MNDNKRVEICAICNAEYVGWGNNAYPFPGRCCDVCNAKYVIEARIDRLRVQAKQDALEFAAKHRRVK